MLIPFARIRKIVNSSSVKPQSRSNRSRSSRGNCSLFFALGVVKLRRILSVVIGHTLHPCVKKCIGEAVRSLYAIQAAEIFYGFFHIDSSVMSVYKDFQRAPAVRMHWPLPAAWQARFAPDIRVGHCLLYSAVEIPRSAPSKVQTARTVLDTSSG